jgi:hypothetical protein
MMTFATSAFSQGGPGGPGGPGQPSAEDLAKLAANKTVSAGDTLIVDKTTTLESLKVEEGAAVAAPAGKSLTLTVDGVQKDILPGKYVGKIVLTVTDLHKVTFQTYEHHFRQGFFLDANGLVDAKSVTAADGDFKIEGNTLTGGNIQSAGQNFNGLVAVGGTWTVKGLKLNFEGNGGNDFAGYGAGVMSDGKGTTLIVDGAEINAHGAVRTTVIANNTSNLIVKNSKVAAHNGTLASDYVSNVTPGQMKDAPWMLGVKGNARATNILGDNTTANYISDDLSSDGWGVLSIDASQNTVLTAINDKVTITGESGYGSYAIGNSTNTFYGTTVTVPDYGQIITGGHAVFAASTKATVAKLNTERKLHLSDAELANLPEQQTTVNAGRADLMIWGDATVKVSDGTQLNSDEVIFLDKAAKAAIDVDGSKGAKLNSKKGVILQMINSDDPGPVMVDGTMVNKGVYKDPTDAPAKAKDFDLAASHDTDVVAKFTSIDLKGDFYNGVRTYTVGAAMGNDQASAKAHDTGMNMVLTFTKSKVEGVITSSTAKHLKSEISAADYKLMGEVTNTASAAINNGAVVTLNDSTWTVTGPSYLTALTIGKGSKVEGANGAKLTMTVNGKAQAVKNGTFKGAIVIEPAK